MKLRDRETRFHSQQAEDLSFKPKLFAVYRWGSSQLTVFPSCWRNQCGSTDTERGNQLAGVSVYIPRVLVHFLTFTEASYLPGTARV